MFGRYNTVRTALACAHALLLLGGAAAPAAAQSLQRFSVQTAAGLDEFGGESAVVSVQAAQIILDVSVTVRLSDRWQIYVRPWFRRPRAPSWDNEIYQAELRYERPGAVATRVEAGYLASPIGLGMMDIGPSVNPTIVPHLSYLTPMPAFDRGAPRVAPMASTYPLGAQVTASTTRWDARAAVVNSAPNRVSIIGAATHPRPTPVFEAGAGVTPATGLRFGVSFARGQYVTARELTPPASKGRDLTLTGLEGEYAFGHTKISGELSHDALGTAAGTAHAYSWFIQGTETLTPRWFAAARHEGVSAPRALVGDGSRPQFKMVETTIGFRVSPEITLRSSYYTRRAYGRPAWDHQLGASIVWARRWW
jgi:hypothetical protein